MHLCRILGIFLICVVCAGKATAAEVAQHVNKTDLRLLIDVSGSMKLNDPNNLRAPALRLIVGLLGDKSKAGVWLFGEHSQLLVPVSEVNEPWKTKARAVSQQIHSRSPYTDIEEALLKATQDWGKTTVEHKRNVILLTDGWVDISKDKAVNTTSRQRILQDVLATLKEKQVTIHAIALSESADDSLLRQLSAATAGQFEKAQTAGQLERIFLHLFEQATAPNSIPIQNNRITVDKSIQEATFLIFRRDEKSESKLIAPNGTALTAQSLSPTLRWHSEQRYDLITVTYPQAGEWQIDAEVDPDNRVIVVTDLELKTAKSYSSLLQGEKYYLGVHLEQKGQIVNKKEFLHFVKVTHSQFLDEQHTEWALYDNGAQGDKIAGDGIFSGLFDAPSTVGNYEFSMNVDGTTFKRQLRYRVNVVNEPVIANISPSAINAGQYDLSIIPQAGTLDLESLKVYAFVKNPAGQQKQYTVPRANTAEWRTTFTPGATPGTYSLEVNVVGRSNQGPLSLWLEPIQFGGREHSSALAQESAESIPTANKEAAQPPAKADDTETHDSRWSWTIVALLNLLVLPLTLWGIFFYRKWTNKELLRLAQELAYDAR